ncbi:MAG: hypothetical protein IPM32_06195 [Ignavibacteriae bacterium]|nr:hypothetical protein [Ignavibacteriota bacterium]
MNTGQMMIGIVALGLVTFTLLNFNRGSISTQDSITYNKSFILATTVAQSVLDEINSKAYDEEIVNGTKIFSANDFSDVLKKETGETYPNFDDIDDYNNFSRSDSIPQMGVFNINVKVEYLTDDLQPTVSKTYNKNITVRISSPSLFNFFKDVQDTVEVKSLFSQWTLL